MTKTSLKGLDKFHSDARAWSPDPDRAIFPPSEADMIHAFVVPTLGQSISLQASVQLGASQVLAMHKSGEDV